MTYSIHDWFRSPLGRVLMETECRLLSRRLAGLHCRRVLQIGAYGAGQRPALFGNVRQWLLDDWPGGPVDIASNAAALPFASESVDAVLLIHQLEFSSQPHQVLREAERVLAPEGRLLVLGFRPVSLWGARRLFEGLRGAGPPWSGHYFGRFRLEDWLILLGLEIERRESVFCRPPVGRQRLLEWLTPMEGMGARTTNLTGGVALTVAQKHVAGMTPLKPGWRPRLEVIGGGLAAGTSRVSGAAAQYTGESRSTRE